MRVLQTQRSYGFDSTLSLESDLSIDFNLIVKDVIYLSFLVSYSFRSFIIFYSDFILFLCESNSALKVLSIFLLVCYEAYKFYLSL